MKNDIAVKVQNISKSFRLPHEQHRGIKQLIINVFNGSRGYETQQVLNNVSFEVKKGDFFGIVGRNGSGKSTLLKLMAGIYSPDKGAVTVDGSLTPFIELGVGFNPELTGRENVFLNGALLGFSRLEMEEMYEDIVNFAEINRFMDQKLKNYSSGMQVRLAFSIAIRADSDILVLDEVLAVGDEAFQRKCNEYFKSLIKNKKTVILVTHDMDSVRKFCNKAVLVHDGVVEAMGDPDIISERYSKLNELQQTTSQYEDKSNQIKVEYGNKYKVGDEVEVKISWQKPGISAIGIALYKASGERMFATNTTQDKFKVIGNTSTYKIKLDVAQGSYFFRIRTYTDDAKTSVGLVEQTPLFSVEPEKLTIDGLTPLKHDWSTK